MTTMTNKRTTNHQITGPISPAEMTAYASMVERGDILPACMRLVAARADESWSDRTAMCLAVGPVCRLDALETACEMMPRATEPRLLRAAAKLVFATHTPHWSDRAVLFMSAHEDLEHAAHLDPDDVTARVLLAELARVSESFRYAA